MDQTIAVLSQRALEAVADGKTMNFAGSDLYEIRANVDHENITIRAIFCRGDSDDERLIVVIPSGEHNVVSGAFQGHYESAYRRMLNAFQRATTYPVTLPRGWRQYKKDNLLAFFALPESAGSTLRWIAETNPGGVGRRRLLGRSNTDDRQDLDEFVPVAGMHEMARATWTSRRREGLSALTGPAEPSLGVDVVLQPAPQTLGVSKSRSIGQWLPDLTKSQAEFVDASSSRSIRLRGPAGSGKTLTLCIKAVGEALSARQKGDELRILFVTHSWALAGEIDDLLATLSGVGRLDEINVLPLVAVAQETSPSGLVPSDLKLIGDDSLTGKRTQLTEIEELLDRFRRSDWITYRDRCSPDFRARMSSDDPAAKRGMAWDCMIEFGCVLGADGIFPSVNSEQRYAKLPRAPWMMQLESREDKRVVYALYERFYASLQERGLLTSDQLLNDFLNYLEGFTWNHRRPTEGYDLIFVDEFHLFNALERQVLRLLSRDVVLTPGSSWLWIRASPRGMSSLDRQALITPAARRWATTSPKLVKTVDIPTVHRSSPQILELIKHIHLDYANLNLDEDWAYSISEVESLAAPGPTPSLFVAETFSDEETAIYNAISEMYPRTHSGAQLALAIVDEDIYLRYRPLIRRIGESGKYSLIPIENREDTSALKYHKRGIVIGPAEYLAGLQFDSVLIAGLPDMSTTNPNQGVRRRGALSLLYLAISRASREVRLFANGDFGGIPEVLAHAKEKKVLGVFKV